MFLSLEDSNWLEFYYNGFRVIKFIVFKLLDIYFIRQRRA